MVWFVNQCSTDEVYLRISSSECQDWASFQFNWSFDAVRRLLYPAIFNQWAAFKYLYSPIDLLQKTFEGFRKSSSTWRRVHRQREYFVAIWSSFYHRFVDLCGLYYSYYWTWSNGWYECTYIYTCSPCSSFSHISDVRHFWYRILMLQLFVCFFFSNYPRPIWVHRLLLSALHPWADVPLASGVHTSCWLTLIPMKRAFRTIVYCGVCNYLLACQAVCSY